MKFKRIIAAMLAIASLTTVSAFADTISPVTSISNSAFGELNKQTNIYNYSYGDGESVGGDLIQPVTVLEGVSATVLNLIQTIVNVDVNVDMSDLRGEIASIRESILSGR